MTKASFYDDNPNYDYTKYWIGRDYENASEEAAIQSLLGSKKFKSAADVGGGYGRLCVFLQQYASKVTLIEPSKKQRELGADFLKNTPVDIVNGTSEKTGLKDGSVDLITMIRVMHHLPNPTKTFAELARVTSKDGLVILECANSLNFKSRLRRGLKGRRTPMEPVDIRTDSTTDVDTKSPFVNHHPKKISQQLEKAGFEIIDRRSVSNLRSPLLKRVLPMRVMVGTERLLQRPLAPISFGPSMFLLLKKR